MAQAWPKKKVVDDLGLGTSPLTPLLAGRRLDDSPLVVHHPDGRSFGRLECCLGCLLVRACDVDRLLIPLELPQPVSGGCFRLDLDGASSALDIGALRRFRGVGVIVSHDRYLLDALISSTLLISGGSVRQWNAPYSQARQAWEAEAAQLEERYETTKREVRKLKRRVADQRRRREALGGRHRRTISKAGVKDHDGRSMEVKGRA